MAPERHCREADSQHIHVDFLSPHFGAGGTLTSSTLKSLWSGWGCGLVVTVWMFIKNLDSFFVIHSETGLAI